MAISKIGVQATGFAEANVGLPIPNISLENRAASAANGTIFFNTSNNAIEVYANGAWSGIGSSVALPLISSITGTIDSGNIGSKITVSGSNFDAENVILPGTLRFTYNSIDTDVTVTPNTGLIINDVTIPSAVLNNAANTTGTIQFIRGDGKFSNAFQKNMTSKTFVQIEYVVVAGGGAGGQGAPGAGGGGGGGAGGYRTGSGSFELPITVTVGAGGSGNGSPGSNSVFGSIASIGGGGGASGSPALAAKSGGSGGGGSVGGAPLGNGAGGSPGQGNSGGNAPSSGGGGGGGAVTAGAEGAGNFSSAPGGAAANTSISGSPVSYARGGNGGQNDFSAPAATPGAANSGNGGGGGWQAGGGLGAVGNGGSGIVILKYLNTKTISNPGGGLTFSTSTVAAPGYNVTSFTAGTGNIQLS